MINRSGSVVTDFIWLNQACPRNLEPEPKKTALTPKKSESKNPQPIQLPTTLIEPQPDQPEPISQPAISEPEANPIIVY